MTDITVPISIENSRFTTDISGRLLDTLIAQGIDFTKPAPVALRFGDSERSVAGAQKLIQKWFIQFLTKRGSVQADELFGTNFMTNIQQGRVRNDADVQLEFADAAARIADFFRQTDLDNENLDEKLDRAELKGFTIEVDKLFMTIRLISQAGEGTDVILPVPLETT